MNYYLKLILNWVYDEIKTVINKQLTVSILNTQTISVVRLKKKTIFFTIHNKYYKNWKNQS